MIRDRQSGLTGKVMTIGEQQQGIPHESLGWLTDIHGGLWVSLQNAVLVDGNPPRQPKVAAPAAGGFKLGGGGQPKVAGGFKLGSPGQPKVAAPAAGGFNLGGTSSSSWEAALRLELEKEYGVPVAKASDPALDRASMREAVGLGAPEFAQRLEDVYDPVSLVALFNAVEGSGHILPASFTKPIRAAGIAASASTELPTGASDAWAQMPARAPPLPSSGFGVGGRAKARGRRKGGRK